MMNGFGGMMGGMGGLGTIFVLFWISLLAVVVWAVARIAPSRTDTTPQNGGGNDPAVEALRVRFGRGEIDAEEYLRALETLKSGPSAPGKELPAR
jgi:putative membrane protein